ncbi:MAG TPA: DMT family transporter [Methylophilus sp.]|nr:DMT family transporter [Methylophilus sp.]
MKLPNLGSLWMLIAALGFAIMGALVKVGAQKFSSVELVFYRSLFGLVTIYIITLLNGYSLKTPVIRKQMSRAIVGFLSLVCFFIAIAHLPLATAVTLNYTSPLFVALLLPFTLQEKSAKLLYLAVLLGFIGVVLLLRPTLDSSDTWYGILGLLSGFGAAWAYIYVKQLANIGEPDWRTVFYFTLVSTLGATIWILPYQFTDMEWKDLPVIVGLGVSATLAQLAMTRAYRTGNTLTVASLAYSTVIFASLFGAWFWQESLSMPEYFAIGIIILGGLLSLHTSRRI